MMRTTELHKAILDWVGPIQADQPSEHTIVVTLPNLQWEHFPVMFMITRDGSEFVISDVGCTQGLLGDAFQNTINTLIATGANLILEGDCVLMRTPVQTADHLANCIMYVYQYLVAAPVIAQILALPSI